MVERKRKRVDPAKLPAFLNQRQLADLLDIHPRNLRRWIKNGKAPPPLAHPQGSDKRVHDRWHKPAVLAWITRKQDEGEMRRQGVVDWAVLDQESAAIALLKSENEKLRRRVTNVGAVGDLIIRATKEAFYDYKPPEIKSIAPRRGKAVDESEEAVLHISDVQWGKITPSYDTTVARERLESLAKKVAVCIDRHRSYANVDTLHIYLGGDIVEGETIFPHQVHEIEEDVYQQAVVGAPSALAELVLALAQVVPNIKVAAVRGNHGRTGGKNTSASRNSNWDSVCYEIAKLIALGTERNPSPERSRIDWVNSETFYHIHQVAGFRHMLVHGDQIQGWGGIPAYGINRRAAKWALSILRNMKRDGIPDTWDALYLGHFHTYSQGFVVDRPWFLNGTVESDNEYALEAMGEAGEPVQRLQFWSAEHGMVADRPIYLDSDRVTRNGD